MIYDHASTKSQPSPGRRGDEKPAPESVAEGGELIIAPCANVLWTDLGLSPSSVQIFSSRGPGCITIPYSSAQRFIQVHTIGF
jgi:hypothetical protein